MVKSGDFGRLLPRPRSAESLAAHHSRPLMRRLIMAIFFSRWRLRHHTHHPGAEGYARLADLVDGGDAWHETFGWQRLTVTDPLMMLRRADRRRREGGRIP
ncbi:MAG: hypothetical protein CME15_13575 [Gemmatimonadetes bacterium]|jgi:hypothetical protein|nr:hypothetical protein [Gemmatimonadota bacterium]